MELEKIIISPPFGNYLQIEGTTSVMGTYTLQRRSGLIKQIVKTIRPTKTGWVNRMGFRNPGIKSVTFDYKYIYSIVGLEKGDWEKLLDYMPEGISVEIDISCPNLTCSTFPKNLIPHFLVKFDKVIFKLSAVNKPLETLQEYYSQGIKYFHLFNTIPTPKGAESGYVVKNYSLKYIKEAKGMSPDIKIIGGGGIYTLKDFLEYKESGADYFSISSIFFNPIKAMSLVQKIKKEAM